MENTSTISLEQAIELANERKFFQLRGILIDAEPADIAAFFQEVSKELYPLIFRLLPKELAAEIFVEMDAEAQEYLISSFNDNELRLILSELYLDDTVDIIEEMPANVVTRILSNSTRESRDLINKLLAYPTDSAGTIMTTEYISLHPQMSVADAFEKIRRVGVDSETIYTCYVTDKKTLVGVVTVKDLLLSSTEEILDNIMTRAVISAKTSDDRETVAAVFRKYGYLALPVVDNDERLVGIITVDDAVDTIVEEDEEDFTKMAAMTPSDRPYLKTPVFKIFISRIPWLLLLMLSATFTGIIISSFESALAAQVVLTAFIPMLMGTGGNAGSQASVTVIRGMSLQEIYPRDILKVTWKEFQVSILCSVVLSGATFAKIMLIDKLVMGNDITFLVALSVSLSLALTVICAKTIGCAMPILAKVLMLDPAVMASPFITTIVDALSLLIYFLLATLLLGI